VPESRSGHREKRGGEEGGGGEGLAHHGDGDGSSGFEGWGGSVWLRVMWWREGALGDVGVRHEGWLGKTALPSGPHGRWRRRLGRSRARFCGGGGPRARWERAPHARLAGRAGLRGERELGQEEGGAWRWATGGLRARLLG
jgi:hypothetical protein